MKIWAAPYELKARSSLSAKAAGSTRSGSLLRIEVEGAIGYADLHPWPELGDEPIAEQIQILKSGGVTRLTQRSLALAALDREARARSVSAFSGLEIPESHFLVSDLKTFDSRQADGARARGFKALKFKLGRDLKSELAALVSLPLERFKLRFDFNQLLSPTSFASFIDELVAKLRPQVEFVEDPFAWNATEWAKARLLGLPLALDRVENLPHAIAENLESFDWVIFKPAIQFSHEVEKADRICVTSYLDHPVGQMGAALEAARLVKAQPLKVGLCGLVSHQAYEVNEFSERLRWGSPKLLAPAGTGIGFDDLLENQKWELL